MIREKIVVICVLLLILFSFEVTLLHSFSLGKEKSPIERIEESLKNKKPFVIDFYADWCPPCNAMVPIMEKLEKKYKNKIEIIRVNVDLSKNRSLVIKYKVVSIPTFVFISSKGKISNIIIGYREMEVMENEFRKLLQQQSKSGK
ncbi:MAG: thioredoxin family protein [bacterium]